MIDNVSSLPQISHAGAAGGKTSPQKIKEAAQQFEGLMIAELLKTARQAGSGASSGWMGTGEEDEACEAGLEMAESQLANVMAKSGGFGLTKFIVNNLERKS